MKEKEEESEMGGERRGGRSRKIEKWRERESE